MCSDGFYYYPNCDGIYKHHRIHIVQHFKPIHNSNRILIASFFIFKHAIVISKDLYPKFATKIAENVCAKMDLMVEM